MYHTKKILITLLSFFFVNTLSSQNNGELTAEMITKFNQEAKSKQNYTTLQNAISNNGINKIAFNTQNNQNRDFFYSNKVKVQGISNQHKSGRCWLFTGLNTLRPIVIEKLKLNKFEFSYNFSFFYDQLEKSNLFLEGIISTIDKSIDDQKVVWFFKNPITDGGQWTTFSGIVKKYGLVPSTVMPETYISNNTQELSKFLAVKLRTFGMELRQMKGKKADKIRTRKNQMLSEIYFMLSVSLGEPPTEFEWRYQSSNSTTSPTKKYSPKSFYKEFVNVDLDNYVMFMNDPSRAYNEVYEIEYDRNLKEGENWKYINLNIEQIKKMASKSIIGNEAMYFSCDVGKFLDMKTGTLDVNNFNYESAWGVKFGMNKKQRIETFASGSSHGMALVGVDIGEDGKIKKWLLENSWGVEKGFKGYLNMSDKWFDEYMFRVVINKKYIPADILKILTKEPILLPPWDPMFQADK